MVDKISHVEFELTYLCNLHCMHCFNSAHSKTPELNTEKVKDVLRQIKDVGINEVHFNGGEPLTRSDIYELLRHSTNIGLMTRLETNAVLLTQPELLEGFSNFSVRASIDGPEEVHNVIRPPNNKKVNVFRTAMRNLESAKTFGVPVQITTSVNKLNFSHMYELAEQANEYGMDDIRLRLTLPAGFALENWQMLGGITEEDIMMVGETAKRIKVDFPNMKFDCSTLSRAKPGNQEVLTINPEGKVKYYKFANLFVGDLNVEPLAVVIERLQTLKMDDETTKKISGFIDKVHADKGHPID